MFYCLFSFYKHNVDNCLLLIQRFTSLCFCWFVGVVVIAAGDHGQSLISKLLSGEEVPLLEVSLTGILRIIKMNNNTNEMNDQ